MRKAVIWVLVLFYGALLSITLFQKTARCDLSIMLLGAKRQAEGTTFYRLTDSQEHTKPPLGTMLFIPLTKIAEASAARAWDLLLVLMTAGLFYFLSHEISFNSKASPFVLSLAVFGLTFNSWNSELRCGQFNVLLFVLTLLSAQFGGLLAGVLLFVTVICKPTFILFLPWVFLFGRASWRDLILGMAVAGLLLCGIYGMLFGWDHLISDHRAYLAFAKLSSEKHVARYDNHGIPSALSFFSAKAQLSTWLQAMGLVLSTLVCLWSKDRYRSLGWVAIFSVLFSPMAWVQNFTLFIVWCFFLVDDTLSEKVGWRRCLFAVSILSFFIAFQVLNPTIYRLPWFNTSWSYRLPFTLTCLSLICFLIARRGAPPSRYV